MAFKSATFKPIFGDKVTEKAAASKAQSAFDIGKACLDADSNYDVVLTKFLKAVGLGQSNPLHVEIADHFLAHGIIGGVERRKPDTVKPEPTKQEALTDAQKAAQAALTAAKRAARKADLAAQVREEAKRQALITFIMPNDLPLGECTGTYVARLGGRFSKVGKIAGRRLIKDVPAAVKAVGTMETSLAKAKS